MSERWIVKASPLIVLSKTNQQELLLDLCDEVVVPSAVVQEIEAGPESDPARQFLAREPLPTAEAPMQPEVLAWDLGRGESAVLSQALLNPGWRAVIDDGLARRCAVALNVPLIGTLGVILRARRAGRIPAAAPLLRELQTHNFHLNEEVIRKALWEVAGEKWDTP